MGGKANRRKAPKRKLKLKLPALKVRLRALVAPPLAALTLLAAIVGVRALLDQPVERLIIEGTFERVSPLDVEAAVSDELEKGFLSADLDILRERVRALDWADHVEVERIWPGTLSIAVTEHRAAARWGEKGLLDVRGELFVEDRQYEFPELPRLSGPPGSEREVAKLYLSLRGRLTEAGLALESLSLDERGAWSVGLKSGQTLRLGRRDVGERLDRFFEAAAPTLSRDFSRVAYVDLRYTNGFAVGWVEDARPDVRVSQLQGRANSG